MQLHSGWKVLSTESDPRKFARSLMMLDESALCWATLTNLCDSTDAQQIHLRAEDLPSTLISDDCVLSAQVNPKR